ncbi:hypothetical protein [Paenibacillus sp. MMO-177]|uniref:hypothetical protein n=1 Tax=Paenibacillus sp. MMO-177 TaxID=3081289 RepID=UPI003015FCEC
MLKIGRGGNRAGAGRKKSGKTTKPVRLLLNDEKWLMVDKIVQHTKRPMSEVLADIVEHGLEVKLLEFMRNDGTYEWEEARETDGI